MTPLLEAFARAGTMTKQRKEERRNVSRFSSGYCAILKARCYVTNILSERCKLDRIAG